MKESVCLATKPLNQYLCSPCENLAFHKTLSLLGELVLFATMNFMTDKPISFILQLAILYAFKSNRNMTLHPPYDHSLSLRLFDIPYICLFLFAAFIFSYSLNGLIIIMFHCHTYPIS